MSQTHRVTLTIKQKDAGFSAWIRSDQHPNETEIPLDVDRDRLRELNRELLENLAIAIGRISSLQFGDLEDMTKDRVLPNASSGSHVWDTAT